MAADGFTTGTSFENMTNGAFHADLDDSGGTQGAKFWILSDDAGGATVRGYGAGEAYDYEAKGSERQEYFDLEPETDPGKNLKYLDTDIASPLDRCIAPRLGDSGAGGLSVSNVLVRTDGYDGIYADTLVRFTPSLSAPVVDSADKIVVWMRLCEKKGRVVTNLMVTAGYYVGGFDKIETADYVIASPCVAADAWCRLTIRALSNITVNELRRTPGFTVYLDGQPAVAETDYAIGSDYRSDWLVPEARLLISERRLFPWIAPSGQDKSMTLSRMSFSGQGAVDDVLFSTERPGHVVPDNVFTLQWDAGILSLNCVVSNASRITTYRIDDAKSQPHYRDYALGTNRIATVTVTDVVYDRRNDYSNGVWSARNGCTVSGNVFSYDGSSMESDTSVNPVGVIGTSRNCVGVGGSGFTKFSEAKAKAKELGSHTIVLLTNLVVSTDGGVFRMLDGESFDLDLAGHTLQGGKGTSEATVLQNGGSLRIYDTVGGGAVLPPAGKTVSVSSTWSNNTGENAKPKLIIEAGRYDGEVRVSNRVGEVDDDRCVIDGGAYTNWNEGTVFYLEQFVTNTSLYFDLDDTNYWSVAATEAFIWCGKGADDQWTTGENWRGGVAPGAGDMALFPRRAGDAGGWAVDFGDGVATTRLWLDADIIMSGTNEFRGVEIVSGNGRLAGSGVATFTGALPGKLTSDYASSREIRLAAGWAGTVRIVNISKTPLGNIASWGTDSSKVEFNGVRGYLSDRGNYSMPYELVLTDLVTTKTTGTVTTNSAWKNETGYTGSVVSFPKLSGSGTFESPKNLREILQVFQFESVESFTGRFCLGGKRLMLGPGSVYKSSRAGSFTYANGVGVRSGLGWEGVNAYFGENLFVRGETNDVLMTYTDTGSVPSVENVTVMLLSSDGMTNECSLAVFGRQIVVTNVVKASRRTASANGESVLAENIGSVAKHGETIEIPAGSAVAIVGNNVVINGRTVSTVPDYYVLNKVVKANGGQTVSVSFDEQKVTPSLAEFTVSSGSLAVITVENAKPGLWYGLRSISSLAQNWEDADVTWKTATGDTVKFEPEATGTSAFYQVIVTDAAPSGNAP